VLAVTGTDAELLAPGPVTAAVTCFFGRFAGCTAAGIAKFLRGRAFFPVAGGARVVLVGFAAGAGVFGRTVLMIEDIVLIIGGCAGDWF